MVVEVKAEAEITAVDFAQMINYLKICDVDRGLLLNVGGKSLDWKRVISTGFPGRHARADPEGAPNP